MTDKEKVGIQLVKKNLTPCDDFEAKNRNELDEESQTKIRVQYARVDCAKRCRGC